MCLHVWLELKPPPPNSGGIAAHSTRRPLYVEEGKKVCRNETERLTSSKMIYDESTRPSIPSSIPHLLTFSPLLHSRILSIPKLYPLPSSISFYTPIYLPLLTSQPFLNHLLSPPLTLQSMFIRSISYPSFSNLIPIYSLLSPALPLSQHPARLCFLPSNPCSSVPSRIPHFPTLF